MSLKEFIALSRARVNRTLERVIPTADDFPERLHGAIRYALFNGGKRVRPVLVYATAEIFATPLAKVDRAACAVELIHCYSLIHDDLPAMDDDDLRRGKPSCHIAFDEATAILAGDAMQALAFEQLASPDNAVSEPTRLKMIQVLARASGNKGMVAGQALDLEAVGRSLALEQLEKMHLYKTGALIEASVELGALASERADEPTLRSLRGFARRIGLAFQIQDDILDVEGDTGTLGKTQGSDRANNKPTYPALLGLEGAKNRGRKLVELARGELKALNRDTHRLAELADYIIHRNF